MKNTLLLLIILLTTNFAFGQNKPKEVNFGIQFLDTINLPSKHNYIVSVKLYPILKNESKKYYNDPTYAFSLDSVKSKDIIVTDRNEKINTILIPPLKPNRFYVLEAKYTGRYNIFGVFRDIHSSQDNKWLEEYDETKEEWLKTVRQFNEENEGKQLFFHPSITELRSLKEKLIPIDLISEIDTIKVRKVVFKHFEILNFRKNYISNEDVLNFSRQLVEVDTVDKFTFLLFFEHLGKIPDYLNLYNFYTRRLKSKMENSSFINHNEFETLVKNALKKEKDSYIKTIEEHNLPNESLSNYIGQIEEAYIYSTSNNITTYSENYETGYKRTLVPDFGYITYIPYEGSIKGGSPYVGVHISLSPVNKNVPLKLSQLSFSQRFSIHTGVTLNSLEKDGFRDDFFSNYSLMLGGGYKVLTQSTRLNFGGLFFKKLDAVSGNSSIAIQPYIGISIDIEIRKWLEGIIPTFTKNLKAN